MIPSSRIVRHKASGSYSLFSDLFRYELIRKGRGIWIDCDVYCVRPIQAGDQHVYGWEYPNSINGAVFGLPANSPVLAKLMAIFEAPSPVFPWLKDEVRAALLARKLSGQTFELGDLPWGVAGPQALTYLLTECGLARYARPRTVFYPVRPTQASLLLKRGADVSAVISPETLTVHLWNQLIQKHLGKAEAGSAIDHLFRDGTLFDETRLDRVL